MNTVFEARGKPKDVTSAIAEQLAANFPDASPATTVALRDALGGYVAEQLKGKRKNHAVTGSIAITIKPDDRQR